MQDKFFVIIDELTKEMENMWINDPRREGIHMAIVTVKDIRAGWSEK